MKRYNCVAWDFNGTLLDDVGIGVESINVLLGRRNLKRIATKEEYRLGFGFPIKEWYVSLGFDFDRESYDAVANEWVAEYLSREKKATLCEGAIELLELLREARIRQVVISASEKNMLARQMRGLRIDKYFDDVVGKGDIYASGKEGIAKTWRSSNPGNLLYIGDTDHDLDTAEAMGADCVLVACGHQSYERLAALRPKTEIKFDVVRSLNDVAMLLKHGFK